MFIDSGMGLVPSTHIVHLVLNSENNFIIAKRFGCGMLQRMNRLRVYRRFCQQITYNVTTKKYISTLI